MVYCVMQNIHFTKTFSIFKILYGLNITHVNVLHLHAYCPVFYALYALYTPEKNTVHLVPIFAVITLINTVHCVQLSCTELYSNNLRTVSIYAYK
jgi:hypothetical protein